MIEDIIYLFDKGGVVMYGLSNDKRRATRDLDMDFIKYSISDDSIKNINDFGQ